MFEILKAFLAESSGRKLIRTPGTLDGTFEFRQRRIYGEVLDLYDSKSDRITVIVKRYDKELSSSEASRIGKSNRYRFELSVDQLFDPSEFVSEKVTVVARSVLGASGKLRLDGASGLELIREYFGVPAETLCDINFLAGGNSRDCSASGWSGPEIGFSWTEDDDSFVSLPQLEKDGQYALRLVAGALINKPFVPTQFFQFFLNGELIYSQNMSESVAQFFEAKFEGDSFLGQPLELRIHHPNAARPSDLSYNSRDTRRLALSVKRLSLVRFL